MDPNKAARMTWDLLEEHGLDEWSFKWSRAKRFFGFCHYTSKQIVLSIYLTELNDEPEVRNTILHEIAHALCGPGAGHNSHWQRVAREIGCDGKRLYDHTKVKAPQPRFLGICPECGKPHPAHRRTTFACLDCCNKFNGGQYSEAYKILWYDLDTQTITVNGITYERERMTVNG
jgi:predicted SprT family Zn-dependent metalloprotease